MGARVPFLASTENTTNASRASTCSRVDTQTAVGADNDTDTFVGRELRLLLICAAT
jgi:hypothetical protein